MLSESFTKTKLKDPLILDLLQNIRDHRSTLEDLESINVDPNLTNIVSNEIGKEFYIENEFHKAKGFRKLHIEVAEFSMNLKILHCVFFPDPMFDIPIFGMDLVKINDIVSAAIVDLSPMTLFLLPLLIYHRHLKIKVLNTKNLFLKLIKVLSLH